MISSEVAESRLPVGSSASRIERLVDQGAGDGDALALAAGELVGLVVHAVAQADPLQRRARPLPPLGAREAGVDQRQLDVVQGVGARQQVEGLEDEADLLVADGRELAGRRAPRRPMPFRM